MKQNGYTVIEVLFALIGIAAIGVIGTLLFIGGHFISKFW